MSVRKEPAPEDPMEIVGVVLDRPIDRPGLDDMARTFVEEYALMGWHRSRILALFRHPFYAGAHDAYEALGEARIEELIEQTMGPQEAGDA
jgi:hypothetical protein